MRLIEYNIEKQSRKNFDPPEIEPGTAKKCDSHSAAMAWLLFIEFNLPLVSS
jgi:hypothetical protein